MIEAIIVAGLIAIIILLVSFVLALSKQSKSHQQDFEDSQDNLATVTAEYLELEKAYKDLFCVTNDCSNLKYHTFDLCSVCVSKLPDSGGGKIKDNLETPQNVLKKKDDARYGEA